MPDIRQITDMILDGLTPSPDAVVKLSERYPYYTLPLLTILSDRTVEIDDDTRTLLQRRLAASTGDRDTLLRLGTTVGSEPFYPPQQTAPTTESAIDTFLSTYGSTSPDEEAMLERMIFNPTPDYSQILAREEQTSIPKPDEAIPGSNDDRLNSFIIKQKQQEGIIPDNRPPQPIPESERLSTLPPQKPTDNSLLSASLAKIFIKQGHYQRAHEIITQLSLNYPEKSIYFADQLRYLTKLIAIRQRRTDADNS